MPWRGPEFAGDFPSLGHELIGWFAENLTVPSGPKIGEPLVLTDEQAELVIRFYALSRRGDRKYRRGAVRRAKGWGKSPLLAAVAVAELCGPVRFDGWDADGEPVGVPHRSPWVQIAACSEDQAGNTYSAIYEMLRDAPLLAEQDIDLGLTRILLRGRAGRIEPVTASAGSREGQLVTFAVLDETHLWTSRNGGVRLEATIRRNTAKMGGSVLESTNAHVPGEKSVAERTYEAANRGTSGVFYSALEGPELSDEQIRAGGRPVEDALKVAYGGSTWVPVRRVAQEGTDPAVDLADFRRFYLNQLVRGERRAVDPSRWAQLAATDRVVPSKTRVALGFDGSVSNDATALVGCTTDGHLFVVGWWENPGVAGWRVPRGEVHAKVADAFDRWDVGVMFCDPPKWWSELDVWAEAFGEERVVAFDTNTSRMPKATDRFLSAVREGLISHDNDPRLASHVFAAELRKARERDPDDDTRTLYHLVKGDDRRRIDGAVAAVLALEAAASMPEQVRAPTPGYVSLADL
jgi:hypothetical protein